MDDEYQVIIAEKNLLATLSWLIIDPAMWPHWPVIPCNYGKETVILFESGGGNLGAIPNSGEGHGLQTPQ